MMQAPDSVEAKSGEVQVGDAELKHLFLGIAIALIATMTHSVIPKEKQTPDQMQLASGFHSVPFIARALLVIALARAIIPNVLNNIPTKKRNIVSLTLNDSM